MPAAPPPSRSACRSVLPGAGPAAANYSVSAALGGQGSNRAAASLRVIFEGAGDVALGTATLAAVTAKDRSDTTELVVRRAAGRLPAGTTSIVVVLRLLHAGKDYNGPDGSTVGFNYAYADDLELNLSVPVFKPPALRPAACQDPPLRPCLPRLSGEPGLHQISRQQAASALHQQPPAHLQRAGSDLFAEEHPSDANYLAFAGGSAFGVPLDDPAEENSQYTIDAKNIGDLLVHAAHETWKAYLQSANGPCDDTVHDYYWDDDLPFLYFKDVRERPAYCDAHVVPLQQYAGRSVEGATTPNFAWFGPNDCDDMEGCGIAAGDSWLKTIVTELFRSPAWRTQRSC